MQAVILAINEHEQFKPLGADVVVAMLPITDRPVVSLAVELLAKNGLRDILVCSYPHGEYLEAYLGAGRRWGVNFTYAAHRQKYGSAGVLKCSEKLIKETFVVAPADAIVQLDLAAALAQHRERKSALTIVLHACDAGYTGTRARCDESAAVVACGPTGVSGKSLACTGVYIIEPSVLSYIPTVPATEIDDELVSTLLGQGLPIDGFVTSDYWNPLAMLADYQAAQHAFLQSAWRPAPDAPIHRYKINAAQIAPGVWIGRNHAIHPTVKIAPPIYVADNCYVGKDVELGPYAVLAENTIVDDEATVSNSTILTGTYVGRQVKVDGRLVNKTVIADPVTSEMTRIAAADAFLLSATRPALTQDVFRRYLDALVALFVLILTLPLTLLIGLAVVLTSGGGLIRRLPRVTGNMAEDAGSEPYRPFDLLHFETRRRNDDRPTTMGRWLEHLERDRFPELWNIIRGDLRWVGVKPLTLQEAKETTEEWQMRHYTHPSGFTGLWYVQTTPDSELDDVLVADAYYIATRSEGEDLGLLLRTPGAWVRRLRALKVAPALA